ncbi:LPXTG cell wall anchor domain-containing protein [Corynebacterium sp. H127]|uniref:LPXTG cell wall anchor domain-containing protein n=1 Tax=Corynebacterium sp. H127 TaxID=3133418 RepID=UPI00309DBF39
MKRFVKSASAIAIAGAMALGANPAYAQTAQVVVAQNTENGECSAAVLAAVEAHNALPIEERAANLAQVQALVAAQNAAAGETVCILSVTDAPTPDEGSSAEDALSAAGVGLSVLGSSALLSSGASSDQQQPAPEAPAPAPAPEVPAAPEKGIDPNAPQKGIDPNAPQKGIDPNAPQKGVKPAAPATQQRGVLAQTGSESGSMAILAMLAVTIAGCAAFILRRKTV